MMSLNNSSLIVNKQMNPWPPKALDWTLLNMETFRNYDTYIVQKNLKQHQ